MSKLTKLTDTINAWWLIVKMIISIISHSYAYVARKYPFLLPFIFSLFFFCSPLLFFSFYSVKKLPRKKWSPIEFYDRIKNERSLFTISIIVRRSLTKVRDKRRYQKENSFVILSRPFSPLTSATALAHVPLMIFQDRSKNIPVGVVPKCHPTRCGGVRIRVVISGYEISRKRDGKRREGEGGRGGKGV